MNNINNNIFVPRAFSAQRAFSVIRDFSLQKIASILALVLLLIAVQVSTQSVGDWFLFGLNVLEVTAPVQTGVNEISNVSINLTNSVSGEISNGLAHVSEMIWNTVKTLIECLFG